MPHGNARTDTEGTHKLSPNASKDEAFALMSIGAAVMRAAPTPQASAETKARRQGYSWRLTERRTVRQNQQGSNLPGAVRRHVDVLTDAPCRPKAIVTNQQLRLACDTALSIALWHQLTVTRRPHRRWPRGHSREPVKFGGREEARRNQRTCGSWFHWPLNRVTGDPMAKSGWRRRAN